MTNEAGKRKAEAAKEHHQRGEYDDAVKSYIAAGYEYFGANGLDHSISVARGLSHITVAATILRHQNQIRRCQNLCWQGVYVSEAVAEQARSRLPELDAYDDAHAYDQSVRGVWFEFEGDFRTIGDLPDRTDAYDRAEAVYADAGDPKVASFEQFHLNAAVLPKMLIRGTDTSSAELDTVLSYGPTLTDWIDFKRRRLPDVLDRLDDREEWTYVF